MRDGWLRLAAQGGFMGLVSLLCACSALTPEDPAATLRAEREGYILEATTLAESLGSQQVEAMQTVVAAESAINQINTRNNLLLATLQAALPATQQVINDQAGIGGGVIVPGSNATPAPLGATNNDNPIDAGMTAGDTLGNTSFVDLATALTVRDSDGCADVLQTSFAADIQRIYITARALNITIGTVMKVDWFYGGDNAFTESFTVNDNDPDFCLWFFIEPAEVVLTPGAWSVQLYANEQALGQPLSFTVGS